ncbi:MAG: potassium channel family protein [Betaproteobacteria bacterium]|nr:potassium channel family protein [Betaproteobacteria bacterium]
MIIVAAFCIALLVFTTLIHYEVLRALTVSLPAIAVPPRTKLIVVIFGAFFAHVAEIILYGLTVYVLARYVGLGSLGDARHFSMSVVMYFSAETFTSLGYGDVIPTGDLRMLAGAEALNGLLLIGWSASYTYIAMEHFWSNGEGLAEMRASAYASKGQRRHRRATMFRR